jgi:hypothetical protein
MLTLSVAVSFDIGISVDDTSLLSGLQTVNILGVSHNLLTDRVCVLYIKYVRVLCVFS